MADELRTKLDEVVAKVKNVRDDWESSGIMGAFFNFFKGRHTTFAIALLVIGTVLEFRGKLETNFVALAGVIQALVCVHSLGQDYHERNCPKDAGS